MTKNQQKTDAGASSSDEDARGVSPSIRVLQQNTRLAIITLEVIHSLGLPTVIPLTQPEAPDSADEDSFVDSSEASSPKKKKKEQPVDCPPPPLPRAHPHIAQPPSSETQPSLLVVFDQSLSRVEYGLYASIIF